MKLLVLFNKKLGGITMTTNNDLSMMYGSAKLVKSKDAYNNEEDNEYTVNQIYDAGWESNDWENVDLKIDKVKISGYEDSDEYDDDSQVVIDYTITNNKDKEVCLKPSGAYVILADNTQVDSTGFSEGGENIFSKNKTQHGRITFDFDHISDIELIQSVYIKFHGHFKGDSDSTVHHTYEIPLYI